MMPFYKRTKDKSPSFLLVRALKYCVQRNDALDLGCGAGRDTRFLLQQGFRVTAVDRNPEAILHLQDLSQDQLTLVQCSFETFRFGTYDLVSAQWSLPFIQRDLFEGTLHKIKQALRPDAIFTGQFFGIHDTWNVQGSERTFFTREQAQGHLRGLQIIAFWEVEEDTETTLGEPKHWHVFHFIAKK